MYEDTVETMERDYMFYIRQFISYYENTKRQMLKPKSDLLFYLTCREHDIDLMNIMLNKQINRRLIWSIETKQYKEKFNALRPIIASVMNNTMDVLGTTIDDYIADRVAQRIIGKGIDALRHQ